MQTLADKREYLRKWRSAHPERVRAMNRAYYEAHPDKFRKYRRIYRESHLEERRIAGRRYYAENRERIRAKHRAYDLRHREEARQRTQEWERLHPGRKRETRIKKTYGLAPESYRELLASQGGACAICGNVLANNKHTHVDHDHETKKIRGILCNKCNLAVGLIKNDPKIARAMADYLEKSLVRSY